MARRLILCFFLLSWVAIAYGSADDVTAPEPSSAPDPGYALTDRPLLGALRAGGYTLYFRHTSTVFSRLDGNMIDHRDCARQRMLSDKGRDEARSIGKAIATLHIPIGEVLSSPYCRTTETATLIDIATKVDARR